MLDIIKAKINEYNNCDLTIEELKVLYEIEENNKEDLQYLRNLRSREKIYNDFVKIFGEKYVENNPNNINENTICYVADRFSSKLDIYNNNILTYNLRFIYSNLFYRTFESSCIKNLENLEVLYGDFTSPFINNMEGLDNLRKVTGRFNIDYSDDIIDLSMIEYIDTLSLKWTLIPKKRVNAEDIIFPNYVVHLCFNSEIKKYNSYKLPKGLKTIFVPNLNMLSGCIINDNIDVYTNNNELVNPLKLRLYTKVISSDTTFSLIKDNLLKCKEDIFDRGNKKKIKR